MKEFNTKLTKYEMIERIIKAKELIDIAFPQLQETFEYQQLNRLFERNYPHGYDEGRIFTKQQLFELCQGLVEKMLNLQN